MVATLTFYFFIGILLASSDFKTDRALGELKPKREYTIRIVMFWLIDLINEVFFNYDEEENDDEDNLGLT